MGVGIILIYIMNVVSGHKGEVQLATQPNQFFVDLGKLRDGVLLEFEVKIAENVLIPLSSLLSVLKTALYD